MPPDDLFTRDEVLGGLPARRAAAALFLIESRTAHLADQSRRAADFLVSEDVALRRDLAFIEAYTGGREPPVPPTIRDLEAHAPRWAELVPAAPPVRAAIAHMLGRKYTFTRAAVPRLRAALGLDDEAVARAYRRQYGAELIAIYAPRVRLHERLLMAWAALSARMEGLSPFWLTFWLTIAYSFSQAFLAAPTGVARLGAGPGVLLIVAIGLVNVVTMACMAEACARSGDFRHGRAFVGRLVTGYLGAEASALFSAITALRTFLVMLAGSIGMGLTLAAFTGIPAEVWMIVLAAVELAYLSRRSPSVTIATMLTLIGLNLVLLLVITGLAVGQVEPARLLRTARAPGAPLDPTALRLVFGVVVMLYIGHVYVIQCARIVLPRDPTGGSLIRGCVAGTAVLAGIFAAWILAVNGVVPAERLAGEAGTALAPLAERIGPAIHVLGSLLVILLLGMSCLRTATVLFNLVQERLPTRVTAVLTLPRRRADLHFHSRGAAGTGLHLGVRYLGLAAGGARLAVEVQGGGEVVRTQVTVAGAWDAAELLARLPRPPARAALALEVLEAWPDGVRVRIATTMSVTVAGDWQSAGLHLADAAELDEPLRAVATWLTRRGEATVPEVVRDRGGEPQAARALLDDLVARGFAERVDGGDEPRYRIHLAPRRVRRTSDEVWASLGQPARPPAAPASRPRGHGLAMRNLMLSEAGQFIVSSSPVLLVFLIAEGLLLTRTASFAAVLGFGGVIANSLTAGIFPVLLLVASRRKGECVPGVVYGPLGHPVIVGCVYVLSLLNLFAHALVIYREPWTQACALVSGLAVVGLTARAVQRGAFARRTVVELREEPQGGGTGVLTILGEGRPLPADVTLARAEGSETLRTASASVGALAKLHHATVELPPGPARQLKVWAHRITPQGASEPLPVIAEVQAGGETRRFDLGLSAGQAVTPLGGAGCRVRLTLREAPPGQP